MHLARPTEDLGKDSILVTSCYYKVIADIEYCITCNASPVFLLTSLFPVSSSHLLPTNITGIPSSGPFTWKVRKPLLYYVNTPFQVTP